MTAPDPIAPHACPACAPAAAPAVATDTASNTSSTVAITLDGAPRRVAAGSTLADLVAALGRAPQDVATAVDGRFVARDARAARTLREGDAVLIFQPIVGG